MVVKKWVEIETSTTLASLFAIMVISNLGQKEHLSPLVIYSIITESWHWKVLSGVKSAAPRVNILLDEKPHTLLHSHKDSKSSVLLEMFMLCYHGIILQSLFCCNIKAARHFWKMYFIDLFIHILTMDFLKGVDFDNTMTHLDTS